MLNEKLLLEAYRKELALSEYMPNEVPIELKRLIVEYLFLEAMDKFHKTPLRWHPSGKKVYSIRFRLIVFFKMTKYRIEHLLWRIKYRI